MYKPIKRFIAKTPLSELRIPLLSKFFEHVFTLLQLSWTMTAEFSPLAKELIDSNTPVIYAIYHGRMAGLLALPGRDKTSILISNSRDGETIARAMIAQGFLVTRGSATHGALKAAKDMLRILRSGKNVVVTVDGPRGPAMQVKPAVIRLAQKSKAPIIPMVTDAKHVKVWGSWDHFLFPHFFTTMKCFYGEPLDVTKVPADVSTEQLQAELDNRMRAMAERAATWSERSGRSAIQPEVAR
jgi:lysophospholipid acyltransferase (LPLAT)-like uncharacterized protein